MISDKISRVIYFLVQKPTFDQRNRSFFGITIGNIKLERERNRKKERKNIDIQRQREKEGDIYREKELKIFIDFFHQTQIDCQIQSFFQYT